MCGSSVGKAQERTRLLFVANPFPPITFLPQGRKPEWETLCQQIQGHGPSQEEGSSNSSSKAAHTAETWAQRAQDAEYKLVQVPGPCHRRCLTFLAASCR